MSERTIITVGICTYNRCTMVRQAILSLLDQSLEKSAYDIVVLDDGSTDSTREMIRQIQKERRLPALRYIRMDGNTGLAHGRNIIVSRTASRYVGFIDDDAKADRCWLERALFYFRTLPGEVLGVTGPVYPDYDVQKPPWFKDEYVQDVKGKGARFLRRGESFSGPNMILKREAVLRFGGFNEQTDMKGDILALGEETTLFARVWQQSRESRFYYAPDVIVRHATLPYKLSVRYLLKRWMASGQAYVAIHRQAPLRTRLLHAGKVIGYAGYSLLAAAVTVFRYRYWQQWMVERIGPFCFIIGYLTRAVGISFSVRHAART